MVMTISNCRAVQPFVQVINMAVDSIQSSIPREALKSSFDISGDDPVTQLVLPSEPLHTSWVEIYVDGFRLLNTTRDFGGTYTGFNIQGNVIHLEEPISGHIDVICDSPWTLTLPENYYLPISNIQGAKTKARQSGDLFAAYFCEPVVLTLPINGYVRLTDDHKQLVYIPNANFSGYDAFSYSVITDRGQLAEPKCVNIKIGSPAAPTTPEEPDQEG